MEGFAITLDTVIGQAFEDWGGAQPQPGHKQMSGCQPAPTASSSGIMAAAGKENAGIQSHACKESAVPQGAASAAEATTQPPQQHGAAVCAGIGRAASASGRQARITSFMSKLDAVTEQEAAEWRKRAQQLASELQRMRAQQEEYQRLRWLGAGHGAGEAIS